MALVAVYILFNIIVARCGEKRKLRVAIIAHAVMFALLLIDIILLSPDAASAYIARRLFGDDAYVLLRDTVGVWGSARLFIPVLAIECVIIITGVIAAAIVAKKVIDVVTKRGKRVYVRADKDENVYFRNPTKERERRYKIYLKNCVILC